MKSQGYDSKSYLDIKPRPSTSGNAGRGLQSVPALWDDHRCQWHAQQDQHAAYVQR
jgi:hypothetical protein